MVLIVLSGALAFGIVAVVLSGNARTATTGYYGIVADLSASAVADIALLAPVDVLQSCLRGEESGCAQQAQNVQTVAFYPWLTMAAMPVTVAVLAFNFMGDGLRDAADPYGA